MPSERIQRRIESLLNEADAAADNHDWGTVRERVRLVLSIDSDDADALALLTMANEALGDSGAPEQFYEAAAAPAPQPTAPSSFAGGRYEVREFLGEGGKKRVFLAHASLLDREVAFALIRTEGLDDAGRERITREAQAMARLGDHPHVVPVLDLGQEEVGGVSQPYIVSQYMAGGSAKDVLAEADGELPLERTLAIALDVCSGLEAAHGDNVVHRDLSLGNIFLAEDGTAKIGDFGLAVSLDRTRLTQQGMMVGTATYMPPEQALSGAVTPQSDLYSLGVMLYELVTGRPPFVGDAPTAVISQHINTPPVAPSWHSEHCPPDLEALILHLLQKVPEDRPESASEVLAALERVDPEAASASHSDSGANPLDRLAQGVFVGRQDELERLRGAFDEAFAGRGSAVMIVGEPGIGKTRTSRELATYARMRGAHVLWGRTHESEGMPAYWPWKQVGDANAQHTPPDDLAGELSPDQVSELTRIFPVLKQLVNAEEPAEITDAESAQFRLFDAYTTFIRAASERTPLLIILDDLHWADKPSLQLLQYFSRELSNMRVLVAGNYRDTELARSHPLSQAIVELNREGGFLRLTLRGLTREETESYIQATANSVPQRALVDRIFEETEGNPFFLSEVVNLMAQEGTLTADSVSNVVIPDGVREVLGRRLDRLSEECNQVLTIAAVIGREFTYDTLVLLHAGTDRELVSYIDEGLGGQVIEELEGRAGRYRFTHAQMQETLLAELSTTRLVHLNGEIAEALEERYGEQTEERAARLAQHFYESSTLTSRHAEKALRYSKIAAEQAEAQAGWGEAARRYEGCLSVIEAGAEVSDSDRAALLEALGRCYTFGQEFRPAWRTLLSAIDIYRGLQDRDGAARATELAVRVPAPQVSQFISTRPTRILAAYYDRTERGHWRDKDTRSMHLNRTQLFDALFENFRQGLHRLPEDARRLGGAVRDGIGEYYREMLALQRLVERDSHGDLIARFERAHRDDHFAHAEAYCYSMFITRYARSRRRPPVA